TRHHRRRSHPLHKMKRICYRLRVVLITLNWKFYLATLIVLLMLVINAGAQAPRNARVEVIMPPQAPEDEHFSPQIRKFTIYAVSGKKRYKLRFHQAGYVAHHEAILPPGRYTLSILGNEDYLLPGFQLDAGETYTINVPIARLPLSGYACFGGKFLADWEKD